jgi:hypothetical protein
LPGEVAVVQEHPAGLDLTGGDPVGAGAGGQPGDVGGGGGGHQGDLPGEHVGLPPVVGSLGHRLPRSRTDPPVRGIPPHRRHAPRPDLQGNRRLGGIPEAVQHRQLRCAGLGGDQPQRPAGLHRRELPVVPEQPHRRAPRRRDLHQLVQEERARHPGLVHQHHVTGPQRERPREAGHRGAGPQP